MSHLLDNSLLSNRQYGFIKGRSTMLQLLHMMDKWTECLEYDGQIDAIYSDFRKHLIEFHIRGYFLSCTHIGLTKLLLIGSVGFSIHEEI